MHRIFAIACLLLLAMLTVSGGVMAQDGSAEGILTFDHDGVERTYHLHLPEGLDDSADPVPLVVALHYVASSGRAMEAITDFNAAADIYGYAVVYPNAIGTYWNDGRIEAGLGPEEGEKEDMGFLLALIDDLAASHNIDREQVYVTGSDNGGAMALRLACEHADQLAGFISVGFLMWNYHVDACLDNEAIPVDSLFIIGTDDPSYPLEGREVETNDARENYTVHSAQQTINYWGRWNGCDTDDVETIEEPSARVISVDCNDDTTTALYMVMEGGHNWFRSGDYTLNQTGFDATELISRFITGFEDWLYLPTLTVDESFQQRGWRMYLPTTYDPAAEPLPLVVALHGRPGTGAGMAMITGMNPVAEDNGFAVVYPDGLAQNLPPNSGGEWNYVRDVPMLGSIDLDDTQFLRDMIADIALDVNIDLQRVYVTGFSNGGFMTQRLICEAQDTFAAFAPLGAGLFPGLDTICINNDAQPVPIIMMHGTEDVSIPWEGLPITLAGGNEIYTSAPIQYTVGAWAVFNQCDPDAPETITLEPQGNSPQTLVHVIDFNDCAEGSEMLFFMIEGGGHNWPGRPGVIGERIAGNVNLDISASAVVWDFFSQYTLDD